MKIRMWSVRSVNGLGAILNVDYHEIKDTKEALKTDYKSSYKSDPIHGWMAKGYNREIRRDVIN